MKVRKVLKVSFVTCLTVCAVSFALHELGLPDTVFHFLSIEIACAQDAAMRWKNEFEDVCSRTADAEKLTRDDLQRLIQRCDALKSSIVALDDSAKKVYLRRLHACRDLLSYLLETREEK